MNGNKKIVFAVAIKKEMNLSPWVPTISWLWEVFDLIAELIYPAKSPARKNRHIGQRGKNVKLALLSGNLCYLPWCIKL